MFSIQVHTLHLVNIYFPLMQEVSQAFFDIFESAANCFVESAACRIYLIFSYVSFAFVAG